jgi:hypothetical protein
MPFTLRLYQRFPMHCSVTFRAGLVQGKGTIWNFSLIGWKLSGDVPLQVGQTCPLTVHMPNQFSLFVAGAIVRCVQGQDYGLVTLVADAHTQSRVEHLVQHLEQVALEGIECATTAPSATHQSMNLLERLGP